MAPREAREREAAVARPLERERRVHLDHHRQSAALCEGDRAPAEEGVARIDGLGREVARGGGQARALDAVVGELGELAQRRRARRARVAAFRTAVRRARPDDLHVVAGAPQRADEAVDVDALSVVRARAVVVEDPHPAPPAGARPSARSKRACMPSTVAVQEWSSA